MAAAAHLGDGYGHGVANRGGMAALQTTPVNVKKEMKGTTYFSSLRVQIDRAARHTDG